MSASTRIAFATGLFLAVYPMQPVVGQELSPACKRALDRHGRIAETNREVWLEQFDLKVRPKARREARRIFDQNELLREGFLDRVRYHCPTAIVSAPDNTPKLGS